MNKKASYKILQIDLDKIKPYENNPRNNDDAVDRVANSIKAFGFKNPMIIDKDNIIVCGHTRYKAACRLGLKSVPCVCADDLTPAEIKAFRLADNKTAELAEWDEDKLNIELDCIQDFDMSDFGFELPNADDDDGIGYDDLFKENERTRTNNAYNLTAFDPTAAAGFYQMPIIRAIKTCPESLIGFNYVASTEPKASTGVHFYLDDYQFERVWNTPEQYLGKLAGWDYVLSPDFSLYTDMPIAVKIWNIYRSRLIGQMLQNAGAKVIPTLSWAEPETFSFCFDGIESSGVVSVSTIGVKRNSEAMKIWTAGMDEALKRLNPCCVLVYGGDIGYKFPCKVVYVANDITKRMKKEK